MQPGAERKEIVYGPLEPTLNQLRGIRYLVNGDDGGAGGNDAEEQDPADNEQPGADAENEVDADTTSSDDDQSGSDDESQDDSKKPVNESKPEDANGFDLPAAKRLIENLRKDKAEFKGKYDTARDERDDARAENKTLKAEIEELKNAETVKEQAKTKKTILDEYELSDDYLEYLLGDDEESWKKHAEKLAARQGSATSPKGSNVQGSGRGGKKSEDDIVAQYLPTAKPRF